MAQFDQTAFNDFVLSSQVIGFFEKPITLKSGRTSNWYVNWRNVASDVYRIDRLTDFLLDFTQSLLQGGKLSIPPVSFYGVPEGATKYGILTQYKWAKTRAGYGPGTHVLPMGRTKSKEHGMASDRHFVGAPVGPVIIIEDTTTTGGSLLETLDKLIEAQIEVIAAYGLTNRMERRDDGLSVAEVVAAKISNGKAVPYFELSKATALLPEACRRLKPSDAIRSAIKREFIEFGVEPLNLE